MFQSTVQGYTGALEDLTFAMHGLGELVKLAHGDVSERLDRIERHLGIESADE